MVERCLKCQYAQRLVPSDGFTPNNCFCNYILTERKKRPCKGGNECTVFKLRTKKRKQAMKHYEFVWEEN